MELWKPDQISLEPSTTALLEDVAETARRVNEHRPLPREVVHRIEEELLGEGVYSSNALEGNSLDLRETVMILKDGVRATSRKRDALEARNLGQAVRRAGEIVQLGTEVHTPARLLEVHRMVLQEIDDGAAGCFRGVGVMIQGARFQPPDHGLVPGLVDGVMETLRAPGAEAALLRGTWVHWALARIHPFLDGNGRMARLWGDLVLLQEGLTCAVVRPQDRGDYLAALSEADAGNFNLLTQLAARRVLATFDRYLAAVQAQLQSEAYLADLVGEADARLEQKRKLTYERWRRSMEHLRWEYELCAGQISERSAEVQIQVRPFEVLDQGQWENLRSGCSVPRTSFFEVHSAVRDRHIRHIFFFGRHFWSGLDTEVERSEPRVALLISEDPGDGVGQRLDGTEDLGLTLREVFAVDGKLVRKRVDPQLVPPAYVYDRDVTPQQVAQDFLRELVLNRLT